MWCERRIGCKNKPGLNAEWENAGRRTDAFAWSVASLNVALSMSRSQSVNVVDSTAVVRIGARVVTEGAARTEGLCSSSR